MAISKFMQEPDTDNRNRNRALTAAGVLGTGALTAAGGVAANRALSKLAEDSPDIAIKAAGSLGNNIGKGIGLGLGATAIANGSKYLPKILNQMELPSTIPTFLDQPILTT